MRRRFFPVDPFDQIRKPSSSGNLDHSSLALLLLSCILYISWHDNTAGPLPLVFSSSILYVASKSLTFLRKCEKHRSFPDGYMCV